MKVYRVDFHAGEFLADHSGRLTLEEVGLLHMIHAHIFHRNGAIENDPQWLSRQFKNCNPRTIKTVLERLVIGGYLERNDAEIHAKACRIELEKAAKRMRISAENGAKGGRPYKEINDLRKPTGFDDEKLTTNDQRPVTNDQQPMTIDQGVTRTLSPPSSRPETPKPAVTTGDDQFEKFWEIWRHARGQAGNPKAPALKAWGAAIKSGADPRDIIRGAELEKSRMLRPQKGRDAIWGTPYAKQGASWINARCWEDVITTPAAEIPSSTTAMWWRIYHATADSLEGNDSNWMSFWGRSPAEGQSGDRVPPSIRKLFPQVDWTFQGTGLTCTAPPEAEGAAPYNDGRKPEVCFTYSNGQYTRIKPGPKRLGDAK